jgi:cytochrome oxidase Cu insertion factor (SCO1/SenC/PrrC family)
MSKGKNQHVVPHGDGWAVRGAGNEKVTRQFDTQRQAVDFARQTAMNQQSEMFIHNQQGQIRERNTYGNDPCPPKG